MSDNDDIKKYYEKYIASEILNVSMQYDEVNETKSTIELKCLIDKSKLLLEKNYNLLSTMQLHYDVGTAYSNLGAIEQTDAYHEKEIFNLRKAINIYTESDIKNLFDDVERRLANVIIIQTYVNLGNTMQSLERHLSAIDYYFCAIQIDDTYAMAHLNLSATLFNFAKIQIDNSYKNYLNHSGYYYYLKAYKFRVNLHDLSFIQNLEDYIQNFTNSYLNEFLKKEFKLPKLKIDTRIEEDYRENIKFFRLFLNPVQDIIDHMSLAVDDIQLPIMSKQSVKGELLEVVELFSQIKSEYVYGRYLWYQANTEYETVDFFQNYTYLLHFENLKTDFTYKAYLAQTSYKMLYSIFDMIGFFINKYWGLDIEDNKIDFYKSLTIREQKKEIFNPKLEKNKSLKSLFWILKDLRNEDRVFSMNPDADKLTNIRNYMEHRVYKTIKETPDYSHQFSMCKFESELKYNTIDLMRLLKEAIIYLALAVNEDIELMSINDD